VRARLEHELDLMLDSGPCGIEPTTVIDLSGDDAVVLRKGRGSLEAIGVTLTG
jgi:tRNA A37 threonylcarbamoyladenosine synthetase subunit TsaC/SUA5/YrdC